MYDKDKEIEQKVNKYLTIKQKNNFYAYSIYRHK